ncbi:uncharacterized protein [Gossypium hirsutum]|uniref:Uncharacterized protein n=1 Tax=Gossypium hirsutum TaxID=3635 RepID=A0A1U8MAV6_GOSHI|nr:uncharacterized protein LOC107934707 [Gossypium hirsutum]
MFDRIKSAQLEDDKLVKKREMVQNGMKRDVVEYVAKCLTCQRVKAKHQILKDMLRACVIDFEAGWERYLPLAEFVYNNSFQSSIQMDLYKALYGRRCQSLICWMELTERKMIGPELIKETDDIVKKIRGRLKAAFDRQKSYSDLKRRDIEYSVGDKVQLVLSHQVLKTLMMGEYSALLTVQMVSPNPQREHYSR